MIPNPLARQRRLGHALVQLRKSRGQSAAEVARAAGVSPSAISRLEQPLADLSRRPDPALVRQVLLALNVPADDPLYNDLLSMAGIAAAGGWWNDDQYAAMGRGQRDAAITELGAATIDDYAGTLLPGLVHTAEYARHRSDGAPTVDAIVAGRIERQRQVVDVPYRLVLEEQAVRRWPAPPSVMLDQLHHLLKLMERPAVSIRILPVDADLGDGLAPRAPYVLITYPDGDDPPIVAVDQVTQIQLVTDPDDVAGYAELHHRLHSAAVSEEETASLIRSAAKKLAARM